VQWKHFEIEEATEDMEDKMKETYPSLFRQSEVGNLINMQSQDGVEFMGEGM
jgi:thymidylate synthase ThyX